MHRLKISGEISLRSKTKDLRIFIFWIYLAIWLNACDSEKKYKLDMFKFYFL